MTSATLETITEQSPPPPQQSLGTLSPVSTTVSAMATTTTTSTTTGQPSSPNRKLHISWDQKGIDNTGSSHNRDTSTTSASEQLLEEFIYKEDQAERGLLQSMEQRRVHTQTAAGDAWHASVQGERPPLGESVPMQWQAMLQNNSNSNSNSNSNLSAASPTVASKHSDKGSRSDGSGSNHSASKLADIARRMRQKVAATAAAGIYQTETSHIGDTNTSADHRRAPSRAHALLDCIQECNEETNNLFDGVAVAGNPTADIQEGSSGGAATDVAHATTNTDRLLTGAMAVEDLFDDSPPVIVEDQQPVAREEKDPALVETVNEDAGDEEDEELLNGEHIPLVKRHSFLSHHSSIKSPVISTSKSCSMKSSVNPPSPRQHLRVPVDSPTALRQKAAAKKKSLWWHTLCWTCCHPTRFMHRLWHILWHESFLLTVAAPCFLSAAFLFYYLYNPTWNFLPGHASLAWWLNFFGRQVLLLELARVGQWVFIDKLLLGTRIAVQCLGPLLTLCLIQARGWPFCIFVWGFFALMLLEGSAEFERHWLFFTNISLFNESDSGSYVLSSESYVRLLVSMMLAGFATAIKRTAVAMYFGRRTFVQFKPRLEKLLKDVVLVTEMAALAVEAEIAAAEEEEQQKDLARQHLSFVLRPHGGGPADKVNLLGDVSWNKTCRRKSNGPPEVRAKSVVSLNGTSEDASDSEDEASEITTQPDIQPGSHTGNPELEHTHSGSFRVKELLDNWEEPINKLDKSLNASISDILRFRRALTFMDDEQPFGREFGPASNRDELITSAHAVYQRLLKLTPGRSTVSCEFYDMLALDDDGETVNNRKRKALFKLMRPDANNELSLLAFVQSCDSLYKKLRYFRANVGNASVIDHALESIVDGGFSFVLALILLSVMRINPWPLLVSISTLLVSVSFAVGSSASKWFEGMLLVAARRPFDLGDRVYMSEPSLIICDGLWYCWFVEDINLFHTTIRYAGTNEVATINNGSIANMRIINGARSPNACVWFQFPFRANLMEDGNLDKLKTALENYARENPRNWHSFSYCRVDEVHPHQEKLVVTIGMNHRSSWQDLVTILEAKAAIMCWVMEYGRKHGIIWDELPKRDLVYYAGALKDGSVHQHRFQLHSPSNIVSGGYPASPSSATAGSGLPPRPPQPQPTLQETSNTNFLAQLMHSHG